MSKRAIVVVLLAIVHGLFADVESSTVTSTTYTSSESTSISSSTSNSPPTKNYYVITEQVRTS